MGTLFQDLKYGLRMLAKNPGFTAIAIVTLALGLGANSVVFSNVNVMLLRPFPFKDLSRVVAVYETAGTSNQDSVAVAPANLRDWSQENHAFERLAAVHGWDVNRTGEELPERLEGAQVSADLFPLLGVAPELGRTLDVRDFEPGHSSVVVLGYGYWQEHLAGDRGIVGKSLLLNRRSFVVVGVMPEEFDFPIGNQIWAPLDLTLAEQANRTDHYLQVIGRMKPHTTLAEGQADLAAIAARLAAAYPETNKGHSVRVQNLVEEFTTGSRQFLLVLMGAAAFVLLLACANVANLQLARASARAKEMAVRLALGAGRWDIARTLIVENLLVAFAGGLAGLLLTSWGLDLARRSAPPFIVQHVIGLKHLGVDWRVVAFTLGVATLTGILISLAPLLQITHAGVVETLKEGGRGTSAGARGSAVRSTLVVSEVALALVLLVGAGLMVKGFRALANAYPGFDRTHVLTFRIALPSGYREPAQIRNFYQELVQKVQTLPGVECAATVSSIPSSWSWDSLEYSGDGLAPQAPGEMRIAVGESITPDYFRVMHIPVLHGRAFSDKDGPESERVAIVSESLARRNWPGENPIGKHIRLGRENSNQPPLAIVGIVGDVKQSPFSKEVRPTTYTPFAQSEEAATSIVVRTAGDPIAMAPAAWAMVRSIDPDLPAFDMRTLAQIISDSLSGVENASRMMIVFGIVALVLAAAGVFAVMAYSVTQRTHEIGVRLALGAQHTDIYRMVVGYATRLAMMGLVVGVPCALGLSFLFSSAVFGVLDIDVLTFGGLTILLVLVALGAAIIPARRATKVDPMVALRYE